MKWPRWWRLCWLIVLVCVGLLGVLRFSQPTGATEEAQTYNYPATFNTSNQSEYHSGAAIAGDLTLPVIPTQTWNTSSSSNSIHDEGVFGKYGASGSGSTSGTIGVALKLHGALDGQVNVTYPLNTQFVVDPPSGGTATIHTTWTAGQGGVLDTNPPDATASLEGTFGFAASGSANICLYACFGGQIFNFSAPVNTARISPVVSAVSLASLDTQCASIRGQTIGTLALVKRLLQQGSGVDCSGYKFPPTSGITGRLGLPAVLTQSSMAADGTSLQASGSGSIFAVSLDALTALTEVPLNFTYSVFGISGGYTTVNLGGRFNIDLAQTFTFSPRPQVSLDLGRPLSYVVLDPSGATVGSGAGQVATFPAGDSVRVATPADALFAITPTVSLDDNTFSNATAFNDSAHLVVKALDLRGSAYGQHFALGPVFDYEPQLGCVQTPLTGQYFDPASGQSASLYPCSWPTPASSFRLGGFNTQTLSPIVVTAPPPTVTGISPDSGPIDGGTRVVIHGTNLTGAAVVTFGGAPATNAGVSSDGTALTVVAPPHTAHGAVPVALTTVGGAATSPRQFTYAVPAIPATCLDVREASANPPDGDYTLYDNGLAFTVHCTGMAATPAEYLTLAKTDGLYNVATQANGAATHFSRLRLDPRTLTVNTGDYTFASTTGGAPQPYGSAGDCLGAGSQQGTGNIDLTGTSFAISDTFGSGGVNAAGSATFSARDQVVALTGGACGWEEPRAALNTSPNARTGGFYLHLKPLPPQVTGKWRRGRQRSPAR